MKFFKLFIVDSTKMFQLQIKQLRCSGLEITLQSQMISQIYIQSNFNGSNTFGTMQISSRKGEFEQMRVDNIAKSGGIIRISIIFCYMKV